MLSIFLPHSQQIRDTQPEAGRGSPRAAERWYLCISENLPGFGCYKSQMGQCTAKLKQKTCPIVYKNPAVPCWKALRVPGSVLINGHRSMDCRIFPAEFFSLLTQGAFSRSRGHSWRPDPPDLSILRSSDITFPLSLSSVSSHSCVFRCLTLLTTHPCPVLTRCTPWNAALKDHPRLQPRLGQLSVRGRGWPQGSCWGTGVH